MHVFIFCLLNECINIFHPKDKCTFKGGDGSGSDPRLLNFEAESESRPDVCDSKIGLVQVTDTTDECRIDLSVNVKDDGCGLGEVFFKFGLEEGGREDRYPYEIRIKKTPNDYQVKLFGSDASSGVSPLMNQGTLVTHVICFNGFRLMQWVSEIVNTFRQ